MTDAERLEGIVKHSARILRERVKTALDGGSKLAELCAKVVCNDRGEVRGQLYTLASVRDEIVSDGVVHEIEAINSDVPPRTLRVVVSDGKMRSVVDFPVFTDN